MTSKETLFTGSVIARVIWCSFFLFLSLCGSRLVGPHITSTDPYTFVENGIPRMLEIKGSNLIPAGSTFQTIPQDVHVFFDDGSGWKQGSIEIPGKGWGTANLTVNTPALQQARVPGVKVKLVVRGVESNTYLIPIFAINASGPPTITGLKPSSTALGANDFYFVVEVFTNASAGNILYFSNQPVPSYLSIVQAPNVCMFRFPIPQNVRNSPGGYPIQVKGTHGDTNIMYWTLVAPVAITSISPAVLAASVVTPGAPPIAFKVNFSGSAPNLIEYRIDDSSSWQKIQNPVCFGNQVAFGLTLGTLIPKGRIEIRIKNAVSESIKSVAILQLALRRK